MARNVIVRRASPDWRRFDPETSREFCLRHGFPDATVVDFVRLWDASAGVDYRSFRDHLKRISSKNLSSVRTAEILDLDNFHARGITESAADDDLFVFIDDDDWLCPALFTALRAADLTPDGALWGSIFVGKLVADTPVEKAGTGALQKREFSDTVFTNNYAVTGAALKRLGSAALIEHAPAQLQLNAQAWRPKRVHAHLSLANKHPCCTVAAYYNMQSERFRLHPVDVLAEFALELGEINTPRELAWVSPPLRAFERLIRRAARMAPPSWLARVRRSGRNLFSI